MKIKKLDKETTVYAFLALLLSMQPLTYFVNVFCNYVISWGNIYDTIICYIIFFVFLFFAFKAVYRRMKVDIVALFIFLAIAWVSTSVFHSGDGNGKYMFTYTKDLLHNPLYHLFLYSFTGYVFARYIGNYKLFEDILIKFSIAVVICSTATFFVLLIGKKVQQQYMTFSYNMLLHTAMLILSYFRRKKLLYLIVGLTGMVMIFIAGCRGAIVSLIASVVMYMFFRKDKPIRKLALIGTIILVSCVVLINFEGVLNYISDVAEELEMDSRTIEMIQEGEFLEDSGRGKIQEKLKDEYTLFGSGLYGDRILTGTETYAHNLVIEILIDFGVIFGTPILILFFITLLRGIFAPNRDLRFLVLVFFSAGLIKLFFSSSYLMQEPAFYVLLGLCVNAGEKKKRIDW